MASTAGTIITRIENKVGFDRSLIGIAGLEETELLCVIDRANREYLEAFGMAGGEFPKIKKREKGYSLVSTTNLAEDITTATTDFDVDDGDDLETSGALILWDGDSPDFVEYTGKSGDNVTGVTGIDWSHDDDEQVQKLYALPPDFHSPRGSDDNPDGMWVENVPYRYISGIPRGNEYAIYETSTAKYLWFPISLTGNALLYYNAVGTTIDDTADIVDVPETWEDFLVYRGVEHVQEVMGTDSSASREKANLKLRQALRARNYGKFVKIGHRVPINADPEHFSIRLFDRS
jgi:hypothetical protein